MDLPNFELNCMERKVKMAVKITGCPNKSSWYSRLIGETFEVYYYSSHDYVVCEDYDLGPDVAWRHIDKSDCKNLTLTNIQ